MIQTLLKIDEYLLCVKGYPKVVTYNIPVKFLGHLVNLVNHEIDPAGKWPVFMSWIQRSVSSITFFLVQTVPLFGIAVEIGLLSEVEGELVNLTPVLQNGVVGSPLHIASRVSNVPFCYP